jgi:hypothetical protein
MSIWAEVRIWQELINKPQAYANGSASPPYKDRTARPSRDATYQAHQVLRTTLLPQLRLPVRTPYWLVYLLYTARRYTLYQSGARLPPARSLPPSNGNHSRDREERGDTCHVLRTHVLLHTRRYVSSYLKSYLLSNVIHKREEFTGRNSTHAFLRLPYPLQRQYY